MASYADIDDLIGALRAASIDAYMTGFDKHDGKYEQKTTSGYVSGTTFVTMPDAHGDGGGDISTTGWTVVPRDLEDTYHDAFDTIRGRIDKALAPWRGLPDPAQIAKEVEKCRQVTRGLAGTATTSGGEATGAGVLGANTDLIAQNTSAMSGRAVAAFKATCLARLGPTIGGLHAISIVQGAAIAAEQGLWDAARSTVVDIVVQLTARMEAIHAAGTGSDIKVLLKVMGWAAKGVGFFASGGVSTAIEVAGLGIDIIDDVTPAAERTWPAKDCRNALDSLDQALRELNDHIRAEEQKLQTNLTRNNANIRNDQGSYDITTDPITLDELEHGGVIHMDYGLVDEITSTYMPNIASELGRLATIDIEAIISGVRRDDRLGIGELGPTYEWDVVNVLLYELLNALKWDVEKSARNLELAAHDLKSFDKQSAADLKAVIEQLDANPSEPW